MGRSSGSSCLKIIACGSGESVDRDDLNASEGKGADKRGWSFRKRSARHRVLSNTVIAETPSSGNKQSPELTAVSIQAPAESTFSEKSSEMLWTEEAPRLSVSAPKAPTVSTLVKEIAPKDDTLVTETAIDDDTLVTEAAIEDNNLVTQVATEDDFLVTQAATEDDTMVIQGATEVDTFVTEAVTKNDTRIDVNPDESAIVIQTVVRKFLAQRELVKHKKVVKLQAAVRGHLVRRHAVGTLRCVQAIVKMQALVRARQARLSAEGKHGNADYGMKLTDTKNSGTKQHSTYVSIEKLLSNSFARQLLESTPRTKQINLKLDISKSDSAWKWLERWMSVSATENEQVHKSESNTEFEEEDKVNHPKDQVEYVLLSQEKSTAEKPDVEEAAVPCESKENFITHDETSYLVSPSVEPPQPVNACILTSEGTNETKHSDDIDQVEFNSLSDKPILEADEPKRSMKRLAPEEADSDGRKFVFGSRKASSPAFIAAQSKFAELTSTNISSKSFNSSNQDVGVDSCIDTVSSSHDNASKTREVDLSDTVSSSHDNASKSREVDLSENSVPDSSKVLVGGSECGTELSISSTLDSPGRSEIENVEFEKESKVLEEQIENPTLDTEEKLDQNILGTELTHSISDPPENLDRVKPANNEDLSQAEYKVEDNAFNAPIDPEPEIVHQVFKSSPEASPRSHMTVPESQGTPASQVSTNTKKSRSDKKGSSQKRKSLSVSKRSPISTGPDSGLRSSMEQLPKDHKTSKRRNSFGSPRPDNTDQEPRNSSSSNSLPSYMQATESARAKALAPSASPRSSPDVQDKESYIKKRHSLPGANGRQGSPRIQRSMSQAQQSTKGTNERKWQR